MVRQWSVRHGDTYTFFGNYGIVNQNINKGADYGDSMLSKRKKEGFCADV